METDERSNSFLAIVVGNKITNRQKYKILEKTDLDRGQTDRISLTYDLDLRAPASHGHDLFTCKRSRSKVSQSKGYMIYKRTDRRIANAVGKIFN